MDKSINVTYERRQKIKANDYEQELVFIPRWNLRRVIQEYKKKKPRTIATRICRKSLLELRDNYISPKLNRTHLLGSWEMMYNAAIKQAVYAHDWEKLLNILLACPSGGQSNQFTAYYTDNYVRAVVLLLLHHRNESNSTEIDEFLLLVLACRSEESKVCVLKALLSLPKALPSRYSSRTKFIEDDI